MTEDNFLKNELKRKQWSPENIIKKLVERAHVNG